MKNKLIKEIIIYGSAIGFTRLLPVMLLPFYLTVLTPETFGRIDILIGLQAFIVIGGSLQLETAVQRFIIKSDKKIEYISTIIIFVFFSSVLIFLFVFSYSGEISMYLFESRSEEKSITLVGLSVVFLNILTVIFIYLRFTSKKNAFIILTLIQVIITCLLTYYFVVILFFDSFGYFLSLNIGLVITLCISLIYLRHELRLVFLIDNLKKSLMFSLPQIPARLASFFMQFGLRFLILGSFGASAVALQGIAIKFAMPFQLAYIAFTMAWYPYLYNNENTNELESKINKILKVTCLIVLLSSIIIHYSGRIIIESLLSTEYYESSKLIFILIVPYGMQIIREILECGVRLSNNTYAISVSYIISAAIALFIILLANDLESMGRALFFGAIVHIFITLYYSEKLYSYTYNKLGIVVFVILVILLSYLI